MRLKHFSLYCRECINRVCEAASLKSTNKKRRVDKRVLQCISDKPQLEKSGTNVLLTISSDCLSLVCIENEELIAKHDMPKISFASGGDTVSQILLWKECVKILNPHYY